MQRVLITVASLAIAVASANASVLRITVNDMMQSNVRKLQAGLQYLMFRNGPLAMILPCDNIDLAQSARTRFSR